MIAPGSPTVRRRRLAAELRSIRESTGRSGDAVASALRWSPGKISRYERARTGLRPAEVEKLLDYYKITGPRRTLLLALAEDASQKGWWEEEYGSVTVSLELRTSAPTSSVRYSGFPAPPARSSRSPSACRRPAPPPSRRPRTRT
jgi:transcriptional regulator with XRE-family HTH domain